MFNNEEEYDAECEGWIQRLRREGAYFKDDLHDRVVAGRIALNLDSFMGWCDVDNADDIDWDDPVIKVMKMLCDPVYTKLLRRTPADRQIVYDQMDEAMQHAYFVTPVGRNGETLQKMIEESSWYEARCMEGHWAREFIKSKKKARKKKKRFHYRKFSTHFYINVHKYTLMLFYVHGREAR